jgi:hypothetical protein
MQFIFSFSGVGCFAIAPVVRKACFICELLLLIYYNFS